MSDIVKNFYHLKQFEKEKVVLSDHIPLQKPLRLSIDVSNICNFRCKMCPTGNVKLLKEVGRPTGMMKFDLFKKIINDVEEIGGIKSVGFYGEGEPLTNPHYNDMLDYAMKKNVFKDTVITTNASLLDKERAEYIINSGIKVLRVSLYGLDNRTYQITTRQNRFGFDDIINNIKGFYEIREFLKSSTPFIYIKIMEGLCSGEKMSKFREFISEFSDAVGFEYVHDWDGSFNLSEKGGKVNPIEIRYCSKPWYQLSIGINGDVRVCCVDWSYATKIGNINNSSLKSIWNGDEMIRFRRMIVNGDVKQNRACRSCTFFKRDSSNPDADNIDVVIKSAPMRALSRYPYKAVPI